MTARALRRGFSRVEPILPPLLLDAVKEACSEWEHVPQGWSAGGRQGDGWNAASVAAAQERHWPVLVRNLAGTGPLGVSHLPSATSREDPAAHNAMMSFGYVLAYAARQKQRISVLDWGGGAGHHCLYASALLPDVPVDYHCYDLPGLCRLGNSLVPGARFHDGADDLEGRRFDLVVSSSALHYFEDWRETARTLVDRTGELLYIARLQTAMRSPSYVVRQRPYGQGYDTEFLSWFINRTELTEYVEGLGLELVREFVFAEKWRVKRAPEEGACRGFLFRRPDRPSPDGSGRDPKNVHPR